ncbi:MAG: thioredoxin [Nitrospinota bacterium]|nr:thioredoxin [Nitrospinota bacterium]MDH5678844.1 thioredoxin [Nitrospinota bacterium]
MAGNILSFTDEDFEHKVLKAEKLTVVDFWAEWCSPCRMIAPILEELSDEYVGKVNIGKIDVEENRLTPGRFGVRAFPTLLFFRDGIVQKQIVGAQSKAKIKAAIEQSM